MSTENRRKDGLIEIKATASLDPATSPPTSGI
jgi:hypothetical protein